jgi:hypothetical protein
MEIDAVAWPQLHCLVRRRDKVIADLVVAMPAAIITNGALRYFEVVATSDSVAHAIAGALSEHRIDAQWQAKGGPFGNVWAAIAIGTPVSIRDCRIAVPHWSGRLHHVAVLDTSGEMILSDNDAVVWRKLRERMSCPSLETWGSALLPDIHRSGMLIQASMFGMGDSLHAHILSPDAPVIFERLVGDYVRQAGALRTHRPKRHPLKGAA